MIFTNPDTICSCSNGDNYHVDQLIICLAGEHKGRLGKIKEIHNGDDKELDNPDIELLCYFVKDFDLFTDTPEIVKCMLTPGIVKPIKEDMIITAARGNGKTIKRLKEILSLLILQTI